MIQILINIATHLANNNDKLPVVYLAGKVTDLDYNKVWSDFKLKQAEMEAKGFYVLNPLDFCAATEDWKTAMRTCVILLSCADHIHLQDNWHLSKGAKLERDLSLPLGISTIED